MKTGKYLGPISRPVGFSGRRRFKPERGSACYHVMSRTAGGEFLFGETEKEAFRRMMWRMAKFSGVEIFTYALMDNHFHILLVKDLKERFSRWFNKQHDRRGTLWMDRFKSILVEGREALATMAAYLDLNPSGPESLEIPRTTGGADTVKRRGLVEGLRTRGIRESRRGSRSVRPSKRGRQRR